MQSIVIVRLSDMKPVVECWLHEIKPGTTLKPGFAWYKIQDWLVAFNCAVKDAGGSQPTPDQIRRYA